MKILITGATGLIGKEIVALCFKSGIEVNYLTTRKSAIITTPNYKGYYWNPEKGEMDSSCLKDVSTIIHLAGATVSKRWTTAYKEEMITSRLQTATLLYEALKGQKHTVRHFISASGISIYPSDFNKQYTEETTAVSDGFLGKLVANWEAAAQQFETLSIAVSILRIGLVLSANGGAFPKIADPIQKGVGAAFGSGKQWQSWIHIYDLARLFLHVVTHEYKGVYNAVGPNPVSNEALTAVIANAYQKKIWLPNVPKFMMKLILGEMHELLFESQQVSSEKIEATGFTFKYSTVTEAVTTIVD